MARLPFNPDMFPQEPSAPSVPPAPPEPPVARASRGAEKDRPLTVSQLAGLIKETLLQGIPQKLRVVGEISNLSNRAHCFFNLKDGGASIRCVCFASNARKFSFTAKDGMEVVATGRIDFYDAQGNVQLYVDKLEPVGVGGLELKFRALCDELRKLGYFAEERKKPLPVMARSIAVVTSKTGAALQDVINTTRKRWGGCRLLLFDVRVQGASAAPEIAAALNRLGTHGAKLGVEAILLTRGGGSIEDLWAFNERIVADAIYRCSLPIVAAIGHETDTTIAELVADLRCATPTQAAMTLVPDRRSLTHQLDQLSHRLRLLTTRLLKHEQQRLHAVARHTFFRRPDQMYAPIRQRLEALGERLLISLPRLVSVRSEKLAAQAAKLATALPRLARSRRDRLESLARQLESISPLNVLKRGYSYTLTGEGKVLRSATEAKAGDKLTTVLTDGRVESRVEGADGRALRASSTSPPQKQRRKPSNDEGPTLF